VAGCVDVCTPDRNDLKLGTVVVLNNMSQPTDFGFNMAQLGLGL